jgi:hypothetical protein
VVFLIQLSPCNFRLLGFSHRTVAGPCGEVADGRGLNWQLVLGTGSAALLISDEPAITVPASVKLLVPASRRMVVRQRLGLGRNGAIAEP